VNMDKAVNEEPRKHLIQTDGITFPFDTVDKTSSGVFGKSTTASAEKGKKGFEVIVNELVKHVNILKKAKIDDLMQKSKV